MAEDHNLHDGLFVPPPAQFATIGDAERKELETLVRKKRLWIHQQIGRKREELHRLPEKEFVSGEGFYYRGRKYRLKLVDDAQFHSNGDRLQFHYGRFLMPRPYAANGSMGYKNQMPRLRKCRS